MTFPLSPAAQSILTAVEDCYEVCALEGWEEPCAAAVLRAVADLVAAPHYVRDWTRWGVRRDILAIADELEDGAAT